VSNVTRAFWIPVGVGTAFGALLGLLAGMAEARECGSHLGPVALILGTWFLFLLGIVVSIGGLLAAAIGAWRSDPKTLRSGLGVLVAGILLPLVYFAVTAVIRMAACGSI
jgi:hypothetical protein